MEAKLINSFDISAAGGGKGLLGDIDGDGRMEVVFVQADSGLTIVLYRIRSPVSPRTVLRERLLWQRGDRSGKPGNFGSDFPAQIYDIDHDGRLEILCVMDKKFLVLDGADGSVKESHELPAEEAHDCIIIANLTGKEQPEDIILKDRYFHMWALNRQFEVLWTHEGNLGHFPWAAM